jgi:2-phospho-L-lactate guanylyltransferase
MALVPARDFRMGKSRLAPTLDGDTRAELSRWMLNRVLSTLKNVPRIDEVAVLSDGAEVLSLGEALGVEKIKCPAEDMNADLELGRTWAMERGSRWLLIVHGDLPALKPSEVEAMLDRAGDNCTVLAPSVDGGTNGLLIGPPDSLPFAFGPESFQRHLDSAEARNFRTERIDSPGFRLDVDTLSDLSTLLEMDVPVPDWLSALSPS